MHILAANYCLFKNFAFFYDFIFSLAFLLVPLYQNPIDRKIALDSALKHFQSYCLSLNIGTIFILLEEFIIGRGALVI